MREYHNINFQKILLLFVTIVSLGSCSRNQQAAEFPEFDAESHRGGRGIMPENTIPAMLYSLSLEGITTLEMDVHVTADDQIVLTHDAYLNPNTILKPDGSEISEAESKNFAVMQMNYPQLKSFDIGSKYYKRFPEQKKIKSYIPLLEDVIDTVQRYISEHNRKQVFYNIETKSSESGDGILNPTPEVFIELLMNLITKKEITPYVIVQSADVRTLQVLNKNYPSVKTSYLVGSRRKNFTVEDNLDLLGFQPDIYSPNFKYLTKQDVVKCQKKGMKVVPWTPNTKEEIMKLKSMGVDGIITDYPELLLE